MKNIFCITFVLLMSLSVATAQSYDSLSKLPEKDINVYCSRNFESQSVTIAHRVASALHYHHQLLGFKPEVTLLILSAADWKTYTSAPMYGMPHYTSNKTLIVAIEDNPFWKSTVPPLEQLPKKLADQVRAAYTVNGNLTMQPFFDMLAIHELGHAFHKQAGLTMQRQWMAELFCNILLHTYVAEQEPDLLPALTVYPNMVIAGGSKEFKYTRLQDIDEHYNEIGGKHPKNYGWFQCRWHAGAAKIYDAGGKAVSVRLWNALQKQKEKLNDEELALFLEKNAHVSLADLMRHWDRNTQ